MVVVSLAFGVQAEEQDELFERHTTRQLWTACHRVGHWNWRFRRCWTVHV